MNSCSTERFFWKKQSEVASVVSDSLRPPGLQPARLLCPWDSPGKNTRVGCQLLSCWRFSVALWPQPWWIGIRTKNACTKMFTTSGVKCWKTNNHQPGILYSTKILFECESKIETLRAKGNETIHHPHTWTKKIFRQCFGKKKSSLWRKYKKQVETNNEVTVRVNTNFTKQWC